MYGQQRLIVDTLQMIPNCGHFFHHRLDSLEKIRSFQHSAQATKRLNLPALQLSRDRQLGK